MMSQNRYNIGDRIVVFQNSERSFHNSFIGMRGEVVGSRWNDAIIKFDNGEEHFVYDKDIKLESNN